MVQYKISLFSTEFSW